MLLSTRNHSYVLQEESLHALQTWLFLAYCNACSVDYRSLLYHGNDHSCFSSRGKSLSWMQQVAYFDKMLYQRFPNGGFQSTSGTQVGSKWVKHASEVLPHPCSHFPRTARNGMWSRIWAAVQSKPLWGTSKMWQAADCPLTGSGHLLHTATVANPDPTLILPEARQRSQPLWAAGTEDHNHLGLQERAGLRRVKQEAWAEKGRARVMVGSQRQNGGWF